MTEEAELLKAYYRSVGPKLTVDTLAVEFRLNGETHIHKLPNTGWGYENPSLAFMGFVDIRPSDFKGDKVEFDSKKIPVAWNEQHVSYMITQNALNFGAMNLKQKNWFNPEGSVWNSNGLQGGGGGSADPSTGNRAEVPVDE